MQLVTADARQRAGRSTNLRGKVRECGDIVAVQRDGIGELASGNLHAVARVAGEADDRAINDLALVFHRRRFNQSRHSGQGSALTELPNISPEGVWLDLLDGQCE